MEAIKTVLAGAIGVRRKADHERARIHPAQIIVAAILTIVNLVTS